MDLSVLLYLAFLAATGLGRLAELLVSARHQRRLAARGIAKVPEPGFPCMVAFHVAVPVAAALEVVLLRRPFLPWLALPTGSLFALAYGVRWQVIRTLAEHWNVRVMASARLGVVSSGPYRFVRHPNYAAVFVEMIALPMIHTAWVTAIVAAAAHALLLRRRIAVEEAVLLADPSYRIAMAGKPRFFPRLSDVIPWLRPEGVAARGKGA